MNVEMARVMILFPARLKAKFDTLRREGINTSGYIGRRNEHRPNCTKAGSPACELLTVSAHKDHSIPIS
jgi:hypothetical protein